MEKQTIIVLLSLALLAWPLVGLRGALRCRKDKQPISEFLDQTD